jgi:hypothetical protein
VTIMSEFEKEISNPYSTGGGGIHFEDRVQASFVVLMLAEGFSPCLPNWPIEEIKLQGKYQGFATDDLIVYTKKPGSDKQAKLLGQIKHSLSITNGDKVFGEVIQSTWTDFNNKDLFNENTDVLALITGPLSAKDTVHVRGLLKQAHYSKNTTDFFERISLGKFTSNEQREKLNVFRTHLKKANKNVPVTDEELWRFLKRFNLLLYDLDIKGVTLSLLHTLIGQFSQNQAESLLALIEQEVSRRNENASFINIESIPQEIRSAFIERERRIIPSELLNIPKGKHDVDWNKHRYAQDLVFASLMGAWNEKCSEDVEIISEFVGKNYSEWIAQVQEILQEPQSPVSLKNGIWKVINHKDLFNALNQRIFDETVERFKTCALKVFSELNPKFSLPPEQRSIANFYGNEPNFSTSLRKGMAEGLALLGNNEQELRNCSDNSKEIANQIVYELFKDSDWKLWGSLDYLLPLFAEASPEHFLEAVENALQQNASPLIDLLIQETDSFSGGDYLTGLLWALETLAWDVSFLGRVTIILGDLASRDPGGNRGSRPANSLSIIYLPWYPQTNAPIDKRKATVKALLEEYPSVGWNLLIRLIPNQLTTSSGSYKPKWRMNVSEDDANKTLGHDYWKQIEIYCQLAVDMAENDIDKLTELVGYLDNLPVSVFDRILNIISSDKITSKQEDERIKLWTELVKLSSNHKRFNNAKWALSSEMITRIESVANSIHPNNPLNRHQILFDTDGDNFYIEPDNWMEQSQKLKQNRKDALIEIFGFGGIEAIIEFSRKVGNPTSVGFTLGEILDLEIDSSILPDLMNKVDIQFIRAFVKGRIKEGGWNWLETIKMDNWNSDQISQFFAWLPFYKQTWERATDILKDSEEEYWKKVEAFPSYVDNTLEVAANKLLVFGRPNAAINCLYILYKRGLPLNKSIVVKALISVASSSETLNTRETYQYIELIKALQNDPNTDPNELFDVEWAYLPILDKNNGASPVFLQNRLASDPSYFNEVISKAYRSDKEADSTATEEQQLMATKAFNLLFHWKRPPGLKLDGNFSKEDFNQWLELSKERCKETGHLEIALSYIGKVLFYTPIDPDGFWINREVARVLNSVEGAEIRNGFSSEVINSRGPRWIDPTGRPEKELAEKYRMLADQTENEGFIRFATTLKSIADNLDKEADRIIKEHRERGD